MMLDYDGTLAPFVVDRLQAFPYPGIVPRLKDILRTRTRLVIVTGRAVDVIKKLLKIEPLPEIWGCHGAETLTPDGRYRLNVSPQVQTGLEQVKKWAAQNDLDEYLEIKPGGCAFHWRGLDDRQRIHIETIISDLPERFENSSLFAIHRFNGGIEIKSAIVTKGHAVEKILDNHQSKDAAAFLGDDATDEDAFRVLGGRGLNVLVITDIKQTAADIRIEPPDELYSFLDRWIDALAAG